ncbi:MAG: hypothetical protein JNJ43_04865 [Anaerolineales bacterium]|nr:hypothetical protein [Anaerolineales bacterium]
MRIKKVKTSSLVIGLIIGFVFSIFIGITGISRGLGSIYPNLNLIAKPLVCPNQEMTYAQNISEIGSDTYWSATWFCGETEIENVFLYAGSIYGLVLFLGLLVITYAYWYSSIGPAKNDGLHLW